MSRLTQGQGQLKVKVNPKSNKCLDFYDEMGRWRSTESHFCFQ